MGQLDESARIFDGGGRVMKGAWPNNDQKAVVILCDYFN